MERSIQPYQGVAAKAHFQQAEQLWAELVRDAPQYAEFQQFLAQVWEEMADLDA